jgi:hypothetical protein
VTVRVAKRAGFIAMAALAAGLVGVAAAPTTDTLRLNASHAFLVTLVATNQHNGNVQGAGLAIPQNDLFGYFSLPTLTGQPTNPEVFVKILDGRPINGQFWVFYGHLTDLIYDLTVTEEATGHVKTYHKAAGNSAGGFDTSGFAATATPSAATPTPTPSASATIEVSLARYAYTPGSASPINVTAGTATTLHFTAEDTAHGFSGIPALSITGSDRIAPAIPPGDDGYGNLTPGSPAVDYTVTFTAPFSAQGQTFNFYCSVGGLQGCGPGHSTMTGTLKVN